MYNVKLSFDQIDAVVRLLEKQILINALAKETTPHSTEVLKEIKGIMVAARA